MADHIGEANEMMRPVRVQLSRKKGWRMPLNTVSVARPGKWGNPFRVELVGLGLALSAFRDLLSGFFSGPSFAALTDAEFQTMYGEVERFRRRLGDHPAHAVRSLRGKNLACWCRLDQPCHADVLLELANQGGPDA